jgi:hypothetical protein
MAEIDCGQRDGAGYGRDEVSSKSYSSGGPGGVSNQYFQLRAKQIWMQVIWCLFFGLGLT